MCGLKGIVDMIFTRGTYFEKGKGTQRIENNPFVGIEGAIPYLPVSYSIIPMIPVATGCPVSDKATSRSSVVGRAAGRSPEGCRVRRLSGLLAHNVAGHSPTNAQPFQGEIEKPPQAANLMMQLRSSFCRSRAVELAA
jgi:hypothetical protein